jgi:Cu(I)/Ag(I) efflux system membrane fusion protein
VRVVLTNTDRTLLHKQTAFGHVRVEQPDTLVVARSAVLQHSGAPVVYLDQGKSNYAARSVRLGRIGDDVAEVLSGLAEGDRVVTEGALILDSQAQLAHAAVGGGHEHGTQPAPTVRNAAPAEISGAALALLAKLAFATADGAAALAADDLAAYGKLLPAMRTALGDYLTADPAAPRGPLAAFASTLPDRADLKAARHDFEPFSTALADVARKHHLHHREKLWVFQCPMSPVLGTGRWLQRDSDIKNPFFGSAMLTCGEEVK